MNYDLSLKTVGVLLGLLCLAGHALAFAQTDQVRRWATGFPRSRTAGIVLLSIDLVWTFVVAWKMDWGEFYHLQPWILAGLPVFFFLTLKYVDEYLPVRALGILLLLAASPILESAFLKPQASRLLVVVLAYVWIVAGMLWVSQPHLLRDQIGWLNRSLGRWKLAAGAGAVYGVLILICALVAY